MNEHDNLFIDARFPPENKIKIVLGAFDEGLVFLEGIDKQFI